MPRWRDTLFAKVLTLALGVALLVLFLFGSLAMHQLSRANARASAPLWAAALRPALAGDVALPAQLPAAKTMHLVPGPPPPDAAELRLYPRFRFIADELRSLGVPVRELRVSGRTGDAITWLGFALETGGPAGAGEMRWIGVRGEYEGLDVRSRAFAGFAVALVIIGWAAWALSRRITRPVSELQQAMRRFGREGRLVAAAAPMAAAPTGSAAQAPAELRELLSHFDQVAAERAALDAERRTMLAAISHDLRSPLGRIRVAAELLPDDDEGVAARREAIVRNVQAVDRLLGSFIDFARTDSEVFDQAVNVVELARRVAAEEPDVELSAPPAGSPALIVPWAHPLALERALRNLVDNARRHGAPPLRLSVALAEPGWATLTVRDHGLGIASAEDRARLVLPFQRGEQGRRTPGTGLGLAIVARAAERCGGQLLLEDARPGLAATLRLPLAPAPGHPGI